MRNALLKASEVSDANQNGDGDSSEGADKSVDGIILSMNQ